LKLKNKKADLKKTRLFCFARNCPIT